MVSVSTVLQIFRLLGAPLNAKSRNFMTVEVMALSIYIREGLARVREGG